MSSGRGVPPTIDRKHLAASPSWIMTHKTYASTARDALGALQDISAKLDRLIDLIADTSPVGGPTRSIVSRNRRLAS